MLELESAILEPAMLESVMLNQDRPRVDSESIQDRSMNACEYLYTCDTCSNLGSNDAKLSSIYNCLFLVADLLRHGGLGHEGEKDDEGG